MLVLKCVMAFDIFVIVMLLAWLVWSLFDDEAFDILEFEKESGPDPDFWLDRSFTECNICLSAIKLYDEAIWYSKIDDYDLVYFLSDYKYSITSVLYDAQNL